MELYWIAGIVVVTVIGFMVMLSGEQRDKDRRQRNGLTPGRYNDITDANITTVYTLRDR